jgi:hypothetical protein
MGEENRAHMQATTGLDRGRPRDKSGGSPAPIPAVRAYAAVQNFGEATADNRARSPCFGDLA